MKLALTPAVLEPVRHRPQPPDKDRFRRDLGNVENAYQQVLEVLDISVRLVEKLIFTCVDVQNKLNSTVISRL